METPDWQKYAEHHKLIEVAAAPRKKRGKKKKGTSCSSQEEKHHMELCENLISGLEYDFHKRCIGALFVAASSMATQFAHNIIGRVMLKTNGMGFDTFMYTWFTYRL